MFLSKYAKVGMLDIKQCRVKPSLAKEAYPYIAIVMWRGLVLLVGIGTQLHLQK